MKELLEALFGDAVTPERRIALFTTKDRRTRLFADPVAAADYAQRESSSKDVYFGVGLIDGEPAGRGKTQDVGAIGCLWADIDLQSSVHKNNSLPADLEEARWILDQLPLKPSILVDSGHGLHAYWLLAEPWVFGGDAERQQAAVLAKGWHRLVCSVAARKGWSLENLGDLARVLRLPGTINHKDPENHREVRLLEFHVDRRYAADDFEPYLPEKDDAEFQRAAVDDVVLAANAEPPAEKLLEAVRESPLFLQTWERNRSDLADQSQSAYDLSLATLACLRGWSDQEVANLIVAARRKQDDKPEKALRRDYVTRTIGRARQAAGASQQDDDASQVDLSRLETPANMCRGAPSAAERPTGLFNDDCDEDPGPTPDELLDMPGFVHDVMQYSLDNAPYPDRALAFAGALSLQALLAGRKVRDASDNRTNLYVVALANSGAGKNFPRTTNEKILLHAGMAESLGDEIGSSEGMLDDLELTPHLLFQTDEIDYLMKSMNLPKESRYQRIMQALLKLFSSASGLYIKRKKVGKQRGYIDQPCVCLFGTAIPEAFYQALSLKMLTNGWFARLLILETRRRGEGREEEEIDDVPQSILETASWWAEFQPGRQGNLQEFHPQPIRIETTADAKRRFQEFRQCGDAEYRRGEEAGNQARMAIWARAVEKAKRLALIYACSENHEKPLIGEAAADWACRMVAHQTQRMLFMASLHVSDSDFESKCKRVLDVLHQWHEHHNDEWMSYRDLSRKLRWSKRDHDEIRATLLDQELIEYDVRKTGGRSRQVYRLLAASE